MRYLLPQKTRGIFLEKPPKIPGCPFYFCFGAVPASKNTPTKKTAVIFVRIKATVVTYPPRKLTWNLKIHPWKRRNIEPNPPIFSGSMFVFGGVLGLIFQGSSQFLYFGCTCGWIPCVFSGCNSQVTLPWLPPTLPCFSLQRS